ncbi:MAG TPA: urate hydroxylase PuuD, partial [Gemmatimonadaceae bacterium]
MTAGVWELLDFVARWIHVIAGIMWFGNSLLFNWLDRSLRPPNTAERGHEALGTIWLLHSGGFYYVEKTLLRDEPVPVPLHWFKWQAYTTWLTGMALLIVVYYLSDRAVLTDPGVIGHAAGVVVGLGAIVIGWALYEVMQRIVAPRMPVVAAAGWTIAFVAISIALMRLLSGRAAFLHVGAMLGTIMAGNVFFTIVPSQRELVASVTGGGGDPAISARAKRVSIHNNYFAFPVIALMVSNHFPSIYGSRFSWLLLLAIIAAGVAVRYVLNLRFTWPAWKPALAATIGVSVAALYGILAIPSPARQQALANAPATVTFADARHVIDRRCGVCHST